jgi:hypothetical protein
MYNNNIIKNNGQYPEDKVSEVIYYIYLFLVIPTWLLMLFLPFWRGTFLFLQLLLSPLFYIISYILVFITTMIYGIKSHPFTLESMKLLFENKYYLLQIMIKLLALDMFVGIWIFLDSRKNRIPHFIIFFVLVLVFSFGPVGLGLYALIKMVMLRNINIDEIEESMNEKDNFVVEFFGSLDFWKRVFFMKKNFQKGGVDINDDLLVDDDFDKNNYN